MYWVLEIFFIKSLHSVIDVISVEQVTKTKSLGVRVDNLCWSDQADRTVSMMVEGTAFSGHFLHMFHLLL